MPLVSRFEYTLYAVAFVSPTIRLHPVTDPVLCCPLVNYFEYTPYARRLYVPVTSLQPDAAP